VPRIVLYTTQWCGFCIRAKALLDACDLDFDEVSLDDDSAFRQTVWDLGRQWTVPLVMIDGDPVGGYQELAALDRSGLLAERLAA
jgi:glutaredoxin 3